MEKQESLMTENSSNALLACLVSLIKYYHAPISLHAVLAGLPLINNTLNLELFLTALERLDLSGKVLQLPLSNLSAMPVPIVLLLKEQRVGMVTNMNNDIISLIQPEKSETAEEIPLIELQKDYTGTAIIISPIHHFDKRSEEPGKVKPRKWFWTVMNRAWAIYGEIIVASFLVNMFALASPLFIMNVYDRVVPNNATTTLWVLASGLLIVLIFDFIMRNLRSYFIDVAGRNIDMQLSKNIFRHILDIKMGKRPGSVGTLANTVQAFEAFRDFITSATVSLLVDIPFVFLFLIMIGILGGWIVIVPIVSIPIILLFGMMVQMPLDNMVRKSYRYNAEKHAVLVETLSSIETIKGMRVEGFMQRRWEDIVDAATQLSVKLRTLATVGVNFSLFAQQLGLIALVIAGVFAIEHGRITIGALVACTILCSRALAPIAQLASLLARYHQCKAAILALDKVMELPTERPQESSFLYLSKLEGNIEFRNVTFHYPEQIVPALKDVSFKIKAKEKVGIIGATGSGKSTIIKLIMKFYEPSSGSILIDGYEQHQLDPAEFRHYIGYVPQDVTLFHGTIRENMMFGAPHMDDAAIIRAAKLSTVDNFVAQHPDGFNRPVGERGQYLSGGQRQSVVISRALILDPPVLLFDELSNSMDDKTNNLLIERLKEVLSDKTLVLVTHKAIMLSLVDRLIVVDGGHIVADGPKDEIIKQLADRQIRGAKASSPNEQPT